MPDYNSENERVKHQYRVWLQDAQGFSEDSIDQALSAIHAFEEHTGFRPFRRFHFEQARAFTRDLKERINPKTGKLYSKATLNGIFGALRKFFRWLGGQPLYRRHVTTADADYFRLNEKEARIARATRPKRVPEVDEVCRVIASMPAATDIEKRNRAVIAFALLTCARVSAIISAKVRHVNLADGVFFQDAREVKTKRSKTFNTCFFPVGGLAREIVEDWITFLTAERGFGPDDPLFPATKVGHDGSRRFVPAGLSRRHWQTDQPVRDTFRAAFLADGLPPPNPHVIRDTLVHLGMKLCRGEEEFKAWSQNLGHDSVRTTLGSYGTLDYHRQEEIMRGIGEVAERRSLLDEEPDAALIQRVLDHVKARMLAP